MSTYEYGISGTAAMDEDNGLTLDTVVRVTNIAVNVDPCYLPVSSVTLENKKNNVNVSFETWHPEDFTALDRYQLILKKVE